MNTRKYWYRKILIMIVTFSMVVGGSYYLIEAEQGKLQREVSAATTDKTMVIPGGMPIGIYLETNGVMVLGTDAIEGIDGEKHNPSEHLVKAGDYITEVNGEAINTKNELIQKIEKLSNDDVILTLHRNQDSIKVKTKAVSCEKDKYKLGIWVRDNTQGLGTVTYLDANSRFGALGHGIHDVDTSKLLEIEGGTVYTTSVKDIQKGKTGTPGGMEGIIVYNLSLIHI